MSFAIETSNLSFGFRKDQLVVENLDLLVPKGSIFGFLGANGAGKSTTIRLITGLLPTHCRVDILGESLKKNSPGVFKKMGALIEDAALYDHLSGAENLQLACLYHGIPRKRVLEVLHEVGLSDAGPKKVKNFSMGMKQRLGLAIALLPRPELLILDEPVNGLDPKGIKDIREILLQLNKERGTTIFLSSHVLSEVEKTCSHVGVIDKGKLQFQGKMEELKLRMNETVSVIIDTPDIEKVQQLLPGHSGNPMVLNSSQVQVLLANKEDIPELISKLAFAGIRIYAVEKPKESLEDWYLNLVN